MYIKVKERPVTSEEQTPQAFGLLRAYLAIRGYSQEWIEEAIGGNPGGRSKLEIIESLQEALRTEDGI